MKKKRETDEEKIARYKAKEQNELDNIADMADQDAIVSDAYGGSLEINQEFEDRFQDALDNKVEKRTAKKINRALRK